MTHARYALLKTSVILLTIALWLAGCAANYQTVPAYQTAQSAYDKAKATPGVSENASVAMYDASKYLDRAQKAEAEEEIVRLSKLAEKQVNYAVAVADQKMAEKKMEALEIEKQKIRLDARQKQIEAARKKAEEAQKKTLLMKQEAEKARMEAEAKSIEAQEALKKAEELKRQLAELQALKTDRGIVLTLGDVLFASGKSSLMPGADRTLNKLAKFVKDNPKRNIVIEGHTDNVGSDSFNLNLSDKRAEAVQSALLMRGVDHSRITAKGYGEKYPVAENSTAAGRQQNRRVEIIILDEGAGADSIRRQ